LYSLIVTVSMIIIIDDNRNINLIESEFNEQFPYLKMEFYTRANSAAFGNSKKTVKHSNTMVADCRNIHFNGNLEIKPEMTIEALEQKFKNEFDLNIQILRKSGRVWLETSLTNYWSLAEQNKQGKELSSK